MSEDKITGAIISLPFNIGDTVFFLEYNKVQTGIVEKIEITKTRDDEHGICFIKNLNKIDIANNAQYKKYNANVLFKSKEELLESL